LSVIIRKATVMDLEDIHQIELKCFAREAFSRSHLEYFLRLPNFVNLIAISDGKPAGFIIGSVEHSVGENVGHIYSIDVKHECRRKGIGSSLLSAMESILAEKGVEKCYLEVRFDNVAAINLYLKHGYKTLETIKDYYGFGVNGIRLEKDLCIRR